MKLTKLASIPTETPVDSPPLLSATSAFIHGISSTKKGKMCSTVIVTRGMRATVTAAPVLAVPPVIVSLRERSPSQF